MFTNNKVANYSFNEPCPKKIFTFNLNYKKNNFQDTSSLKSFINN